MNAKEIDGDAFRALMYGLGRTTNVEAATRFLDWLGPIWEQNAETFEPIWASLMERASRDGGSENDVRWETLLTEMRGKHPHPIGQDTWTKAWSFMPKQGGLAKIWLQGVHAEWRDCTATRSALGSAVDEDRVEMAKVLLHAGVTRIEHARAEGGLPWKMVKSPEMVDVLAPHFGWGKEGALIDTIMARNTASFGNETARMKTLKHVVSLEAKRWEAASPEEKDHRQRRITWNAVGTAKTWSAAQKWMKDAAPQIHAWRGEYGETLLHHVAWAQKSFLPELVKSKYFDPSWWDVKDQHGAGVAHYYAMRTGGAESVIEPVTMEAMIRTGVLERIESVLPKNLKEWVDWQSLVVRHPQSTVDTPEWQEIVEAWGRKRTGEPGVFARRELQQERVSVKDRVEMLRSVLCMSKAITARTVNLASWAMTNLKREDIKSISPETAQDWLMCAVLKRSTWDTFNEENKVLAVDVCVEALRKGASWSSLAVVMPDTPFVGMAEFAKEHAARFEMEELKCGVAAGAVDVCGKTNRENMAL